MHDCVEPGGGFSLPEEHLSASQAPPRRARADAGELRGAEPGEERKVAQERREVRLAAHSCADVQ
jgi:hypothetical protein